MICVDLFARLKGHQHPLEELAGVEYSSKIPVVLSPFLDVFDKDLHEVLRLGVMRPYRASRPSKS